MPIGTVMRAMNEVLRSTQDLASYQPLLEGVSTISEGLITNLSTDELSNLVFYFAKYEIGSENVWHKIDQRLMAEASNLTAY